MDASTQIARARAFRALHERGQPLLLPNAWDAGSACVFADAGFAAIATTSGGVAWSLGYGDGEQAPLAEMLAAIARIVRACPLPLSVDFEAGYGDSAEAVAASVRQVIAAGAVGINLEDGIEHARLRPLDEAAARIAAARSAADAAGVPIFINARVDCFIVGGAVGIDERIADAIERAHAYLAAGADGIYPIALADPAIIATLCAAIPAPVNIGARPGLPDLAELGRLGVARVSTATRLAMCAYSAAHATMARLQQTGRFDDLDTTLNYADMQRMFPPA